MEAASKDFIQYDELGDGEERHRIAAQNGLWVHRCAQETLTAACVTGGNPKTGRIPNLEGLIKRGCNTNTFTKYDHDRNIGVNYTS
jgi:hypothetical protein